MFWINGYQANGGGKPVVRLYWTHDGGISWQGSDPPLRGVKRMPQITIANATTVWIAAETAKASGGHTNTVTRTSDRGASWHTVPANIDVENYVLDPIDSRTAFASRSYLQRASIDVTHDGGRTWAAVSTLTSG